MFTARQNHSQNLISVAILMLIICYYAFNGVPKEITFLAKNSSEESKTIALETSIGMLRAAVLMDADIVEINGSLYSVENALENIIGSKKTKIAIREINEKLLLHDKKSIVIYLSI